MANFSPKDLLSPMKKIESSLEDIKKSSSEVISVMTGVSETLGNFFSVVTTQLDTITEQLKTIITYNKKQNTGKKIKNLVSKESKVSQSTKDGVELFKAFGIGVKEFSKGMLLFTLVPKKTGEKFKDTVTNILEGLKDVKKEDIENAKQLGEVGKALFVFAGFTVLAGLLAIPAAILTPVIKICIRGMIKVFTLLADNKEDIKSGAEVLRLMGIALGLFSLSILLFGLTTRALTWKGILAGAATLALFSLTLWAMGLVSEPIDKGADILLKIGKALALFSISLLIYGLAVNMLSMKQVLIGAAAILVLTGVCFVLGIPAVAAFVRLGAMVLKAVVKPLLIFSLGLLVLALTLKLFDKEAIDKIGPLFWSVGLSVAKIGLLAIAIIPGAIAMTMIGIALIALTVGLVLFKLVKWDENDTKQLVEAISGIRLAFLGDRGGSGGIFKSIGNVISGSFDAVTIIASAGAYIIAAFAIIVITGALALFKKLNWTENETTQLVEAFTGVRCALIGRDPNSKQTGLFAKIGSAGVGVIDSYAMLYSAAAYTAAAFAILTVSGALAAFKAVKWDEDSSKQLVEAFNAVRCAFLGKSLDDKPSGIFSKIGGVIGGALDSVTIIETAGAFTVAAIALSVLSAGLAAFKAVKWNENDTKQLVEAFSAVREAFLGRKKEDKPSGLFAKLGSVVGSGIESVELMANAAALTSAGIALILISKGLMKFKEVSWKDEDTEALIKAIGSISTAFAQVADQGTVKKTADFGGIFGQLVGGWSIEKNKVKEGIDSVKNAGKALKDISEGLIEFTKWYESNKKLLEMETGNSPFFKALETTITSVGTAFATVGGAGTVTKGWGPFKWEKNAAKEGIDSVKDVGKALTDISEGIIKFTDWYKANEKDLDITNKDGLFFTALKTTITTVGAAFEGIGGKKSEAGGLGKIFHWEHNTVQAGIEAVSGVGEALMGIAEGVLKFTEWYKENQDLLKTNEQGKGLLGALEDTITGVGTAFATIGGMKSEKPGWGKIFHWEQNAVQAGIESVEGVTEAITQITEALVSFTTYYRENQDLLDTSREDGGLLLALKNTIVSVGTAFAIIGGMKTTGNTTFARVFHWEQSAVEEGIRSVHGVVGALVRITLGVKVFTKSGIQDKDIKLLSNLLYSMGSGFGALAKINLTHEGTKFVFFARSFNRGMDIMVKNKQALANMKTVSSLLIIMRQNAERNIYKKTADGVKKIADAINTIDVEKGKAFAGLFIAASKLKENRKFYEDLRQAVEDIKNTLSGEFEDRKNREKEEKTTTAFSNTDTKTLKPKSSTTVKSNSNNSSNPAKTDTGRSSNGGKMTVTGNLTIEAKNININGQSVSVSS